MQTQCNPIQMEFAEVERRRVVAAFDGGTVSSDGGALLLTRTDEAIGLIDRLAGCFRDRRAPALVEHAVRTLVGQRVFGIAAGYEDLNDHDELRKDPLWGALMGKLTAKRRDCQALAGKSTLNRLEWAKANGTTRYQRIEVDAPATTATCRSTSSAAGTCCAQSYVLRTSTGRRGRRRKSRASSSRSARAGPKHGSSCGPTRALRARG